MKKIVIFLLLVCSTSVTAQKMYLFKNNSDIFITNNDNYNYGDYLLDQNQILIIPPENGLLSNDVINTTDYKIYIFEASKNSSIKDIELNETTGSFTYSPNENVVGEVSYKYYIEYDNKKTNVSYIYFYVKNTIKEYTINFYEQNTENKIATSIKKKSSVNKIVTEYPIRIKDYLIINNEPITKKISNKELDNQFNFYYEKIPNTGI